MDDRQLWGSARLAYQTDSLETLNKKIGQNMSLDIN
jgi:hypothetical protein